MICQTQGNQLELNGGTGHFPGKWDNMSRIFQSFLRLEPIRTIAPGKGGMEVGFRYPELYGAWAHVKASVRALRERRVLHNQHNVIAILGLLLLLCLNRMARTLKSRGGNEIRR